MIFPKNRFFWKVNDFASKWEVDFEGLIKVDPGWEIVTILGVLIGRTKTEEWENEEVSEWLDVDVWLNTNWDEVGLSVTKSSNSCVKLLSIPCLLGNIIYFCGVLEILERCAVCIQWHNIGTMIPYHHYLFYLMKVSEIDLYSRTGETFFDK